MALDTKPAPDPAAQALADWAEEQEKLMLKAQDQISTAQMSVVARTVKAQHPDAAKFSFTLDHDHDVTYLRMDSVSDSEGNHNGSATRLADNLLLEQDRICMLRFAETNVDVERFAAWTPGKSDPLGLDDDAEDLTEEQSSKQRIDAALAPYVDELNDGPQAQTHHLLLDLRHHADREGVDLYEALGRSYEHYLEEKNDPFYRNGY